MLRVEHLSKNFHTDKGVVKAVKDVSFEVQDGEIFGLIGLSGAGKSTLVRCLNLLERPDEGKVLFEGEDMTAMNEKTLNEKRKEIGMIFQHFNLFHQRTVYENIAFPLRRLGKSASEIDARVKELLAYVDLSEKKTRIRRRSPADRNNVWRLHVHWQQGPSFFSPMRARVPLTRERRRISWIS